MMTIFSDTTQFYTCMKALFDRVQISDPKAAEKLQKSKVILQFNCTEPDGIIVINGRRNPAAVTYGEDRIKPEVDVTLPADTLHSILLGDTKITKALSSGEMKVKGSVHKALAVTDLFRRCQEIYPEVLKEQDLVST